MNKLIKTVLFALVFNILLILYSLLFLSSMKIPLDLYFLIFLALNAVIAYVSFTSGGRYKKSSYGSHGSARWQSKKEAQKNYKNGEYGFVIGSYSKPETFRLHSKNLLIKSIGDGLNNQFLVIGPPGSGKTTGFILTNVDYLSSRKEKPDLIITDPKGEIKEIKEEKLKKAGYDVYTLDFIDFEESHCINVFDYIKDEEDIFKFANQIGNSLYANENTGTGNTAFWKESLKNVLICITGFLHNKKINGEIQSFSMKDVLEMIDMKKILKAEKQFREIGGVTLEAFLALKNALGSQETLSNILVTIKTKMNIFGLVKLQKLLEKTDIPIEKLGMEIKTRSEERKRDQKKKKEQLLQIRSQTIQESEMLLKKITEEHHQEYIRLLSLYDSLSDQILITTLNVSSYIAEKKESFSPSLLQELQKVEEELKERRRSVIKDKDEVIELVQEKLQLLEKEERDEKQKPIALLIKMRDDDDYYAPVINMIVSTIIKTLYETARRTGANKVALKKDVILLIDEFGLIGHLKELVDKLGGMRGRRIFPIMIIQSIAQLKKVYKDDFQDIISQCDNKLILGVNDTLTGEELVKMLGEETIIIENKSQRKKTLDLGMLDGQVQESHNYGGKKLLNLSELMNIKENEGILKQKSREPLKFYKTIDKYWEV